MNDREPRWLSRLAIEEAHFRQIREHGGAYGLRDEHALESALARPRHRWSDAPGSELPELGSTYAHGLARSHPFVDGNKRVALVALVAFLDLNGVELTADDAGVVDMMLAVASGSMTETELIVWIEKHSERIDR